MVAAQVQVSAQTGEPTSQAQAEAQVGVLAAQAQVQEQAGVTNSPGASTGQTGIYTTQVQAQAPAEVNNSTNSSTGAGKGANSTGKIPGAAGEHPVGAQAEEKAGAQAAKVQGQVQVGRKNRINAATGVSRGA